MEESDRNDDVTTKYRAIVGYSYHLGTRDYRGSTRKWGWTELYPTPRGAEAVIAQYHIGRDVTVYYDPAAPATAVLEPSNRAGTYAPLFFSAGFGTAALVMVWCFQNAT